MIGYDFDKTILSKDSTVEFYKFCLARTPRLWANLFYQAGIGIIFKLGFMKKTAYKEKMFSFLRHIKNVDKMVAEFWKKHEKYVNKFYFKTRRPDDVIISASPEFLLEPIVAKINPTATLIGSRVDKHTGEYTGLNCYGAEKVNRFVQVYGDIRLEAFFSDSMSDMPMFKLADKQYLVKKGQIERLDLFTRIIQGLD